MKISPKPTSTNGADTSTSSPAVFPASLSVTPASDEARRMTATSGRRCLDALTKSGPLGSLVRMLVASPQWFSPARLLRWEVRPIFSARVTTTREPSSPTSSTKSAETLKISDIPSSRLLFRLVPWGHPTDATASSSSHTTSEPTPLAQDFKNRGPNSQQKGLPEMARFSSDLLPTPLVTEVEHRKRVKDLKATGATEFCSRANGETRPNGLMDYLRFRDMLPTPNTTDYNTALTEEQKRKNAERRATEGKTATPSAYRQLRQMAVEGLLPTPTAIEGSKGINTDNPEGQMRQLPTPSARDWKGKTTPGQVKQGGQVYGETLPDAVDRMVKMYATRSCPAMEANFTQNTSKNPNPNLETMTAQGMAANGTPLPTSSPQKKGGETFRLSPLFVEEMMGFPKYWTLMPFLRADGEPRP